MVLPAELSRTAEQSAAPAAVHTALERWIEQRPDAAERLEADAGCRAAAVAVIAASRALTQLCLNDQDALDVLSALDHPRPLTVDDQTALARWKALEYLRIAARDLTGTDDLETVGRSLAAMADDVLAMAWRLGGPATGGIAVIAMGKLGARELNYASDVDVMFVGEGDVRGLLEAARACVRVDVDLRPEGRDGPLVRSLASYEAYWERWAQAWEFQALLKARAVTGAPELGRRFAASAAERVWGRSFGADDLRELRRMKARAEGEVHRRGLSEREVKRGRGGIRDVEFAVQLLQLVHGRHDPALRAPATLDALKQLAEAGYVHRRDAVALTAAYRFLRTVEHRLQLVDGTQVHAVPSDAAAVDRLARVLGYRDAPSDTAAARFWTELRGHQAVARQIHERLFFRPLLEHFAGLPAELPEHAAVTRLSALGFADADRTRQALSELTRGLTRSSRMMHQLLPLLLEWLSESPNPDGGLLGLRTLAGAPHRADLLVTTFRESPEAAQRLCVLLGTSRWLGSGLERHPDLIAELDERDRPEGTIAARAKAALAWRDEPEGRVTALRRLRETEELRIAMHDILGGGDAETVGRQLTELAEIVLGHALEALASLRSLGSPMAVIAMGRFGGGELSYASDLDILLVHDADSPGQVGGAEAAAEDFVRLVKGPTPADRLYLLDAGLRPEGRQGPLARSLAGYASYYARWAQTWERQALLRARPVAGDASISARFMDIAGDFIAGGLSEGEEREIRRMKARIERERIPAREDPEFHLKLGKGSLSDVEWTVQLLQLRHGVRSANTMAGLRALADAGALEPADAQALAESYRFCERTRNRLYLVTGGAADALPRRADHSAFLARSLGTTAAELRADYRRVTRRAREVTERLFYGSADVPPARPRAARWR